MSNPPVITIDGPSGSGKGTIARLLAKKLQWHYLESGALYRVLAFAAIQEGISPEEYQRLALLATKLGVRFQSDDSNKVYLDHHDVTAVIHSESCGNLASQIAAIPDVRSALLERQRLFKTLPGLVTDGRDMGTVVFPDANVKFYLTASCEMRAKRRYMQLKEQGINVSLESIFDELVKRDSRDQNRVIAPLKPAEDAILIDSTVMDVNQTLEHVVQWVHQILGPSIQQ